MDADRLVTKDRRMAELVRVELAMPPAEPRFLVVEDDKGISTLIWRFVTKHYARCDIASSLEEARRRLAGSSYDIVLLDLGLPDGAGTLLLEERPRLAPDSVVVVITGQQELDIAIQVIRQGAYDFITKPFTQKLFNDRLEKVVEEWRSRTRYRYYNSHLEGLVNAMTERLLDTNQQMENVYDVTVSALGAALDLHDPETEEHCRRVSENSARLGRAMGIAGDALRDLRWGAYLHDIGKIGVPEHILLKPGSLTVQEYDMMKVHPLLGYRMIRGISFLKGATEVVYSHHEKYDGGGYPRGLKGEEIPLSARVFALADAMDAMLTNRPYRQAVSFQEAVAEIRAQAGRHFDPAVVQAFLAIPEQLWWLEKLDLPKSDWRRTLESEELQYRSKEVKG